MTRLLCLLLLIFSCSKKKVSPGLTEPSEEEVRIIQEIPELEYDEIEVIGEKTEDIDVINTFGTFCDDRSIDPRNEYQLYKNRIEYLLSLRDETDLEKTGNAVFPFFEDEYPETPAGFAKFIKNIGIKHFNASDLIDIGTSSVKKRLNLNNLMPPKRCWMRGAYLFLVVDRVIDSFGEFDQNGNHPFRVNSWYRPKEYNSDARIGGAKNSDHIKGKAVDIGFKNDFKGYTTYEESVARRRAFEQVLCDEIWLNQEMMRIESPLISNTNIVGNIHIYMMSPKAIHIAIDSDDGKSGVMFYPHRYNKKTKKWSGYPKTEQGYSSCFANFPLYGKSLVN
jgi:hypothetical protein